MYSKIKVVLRGTWGLIYICQYEPGSAKYGNFQNYYSFYPAQERIQFIPFNSLFHEPKDYTCLDVGCNSGELTVALWETITTDKKINVKKTNCRLLGVDIDPVLIERAMEANKNEFIKFECVDVSRSELFTVVCESYLRNLSRNYFDIVFLFSVTMWIHLNSGDEGLKLFLKTVSNIANTIVLEPQPWKCYKTAVRRRKRANKDVFSHWNEIKLRENIEDDLAKILNEECSFECVWKSEKTAWGRKISVYKKINSAKINLH